MVSFTLEKAIATHSSTLTWKILWAEESGRLQPMGSWKIGLDWVNSLSLSCIGEGNDNSLQCSCLENPRDGGAWWAAIYGVTQSRTQLKWLSSSSSSIAEKKMNFRIDTLIRPVCPQRYGKMWSCVSAVFLASTVSHWSITNSVDVIPIFTYVCSSASWLTFIAVVICYCCLFILSCTWSILIIEILLYLRHCQL